MSGEVSVEATGETVGEAKWSALHELERVVPGLDRDTVAFQVVSEGERGVLGVGYTPARVIASASSVESVAPATDVSSPPPDEAGIAGELLERAAGALGVPGRATTSVVEGELRATLSCGDPSALIGRHGQTLDALETLANTLAHRSRGEERLRIVLDVDGYRERRRMTLEESARRAAERASATGVAVSLEPMSSSERRLVHEALKDDPEVETGSEGAEPNRYVVIAPRRLPI